jgi:hypothetical protein
MRATHWFTLASLIVAVALFARSFLHLQESETLRAEIGFLQQENRQLDELRAGNARLRASRIPDSELERLRNDRAALGRLRTEINRLEESADRQARAAKAYGSKVWRPPLVLRAAISGGGGVEVEGAPADEAALRDLFARLAQQEEKVEIRVNAMSSEIPKEQLMESLNLIARTGKEAGLRVSLRFAAAGVVE